MSRIFSSGVVAALNLRNLKKKKKKRSHCADDCRVFQGETDPGRSYCPVKRDGVNCVTFH